MMPTFDNTWPRLSLRYAASAMSSQHHRTHSKYVNVVLVFCILLSALWPSPAPASVEEMYKNLPAPDTECVDDVMGTWVGLAELNGERYRVTMNIDDNHDGRLRGTVLADYWAPADDTPPTCTSPNERRAQIHMPAKGVIEASELFFAGQSWEVKNTSCGSTPTGYSPDAFVGKRPKNNRFSAEWYGANAPVDHKRALLEDPGTWHAGHLDFHRVACTKAIPPAPEDLPPPPPSASCGCF